jgi:hypothetical protein
VPDDPAVLWVPDVVTVPLETPAVPMTVPLPTPLVVPADPITVPLVDPLWDTDPVVAV